MNLLFSGFSPEDNRFLLDPFNRFEQEPTLPFIELYRTDDIFFDQPSIYFHIPEHSVFPQIDILPASNSFWTELLLLSDYDTQSRYSFEAIETILRLATLQNETPLIHTLQTLFDLCVSITSLQHIFIYRAQLFERLHVLLQMRSISIQVKSIIISFVFSLAAAVESPSIIKKRMESCLPNSLNDSSSSSLFLSTFNLLAKKGKLPKDIQKSIGNWKGLSELGGGDEERSGGKGRRRGVFEEETKEKEDKKSGELVFPGENDYYAESHGLPMKTAKMLIPLIRTISHLNDNGMFPAYSDASKHAQNLIYYFYRQRKELILRRLKLVQYREILRRQMENEQIFGKEVNNNNNNNNNTSDTNRSSSSSSSYSFRSTSKGEIEARELIKANDSLLFEDSAEIEKHMNEMTALANLCGVEREGEGGEDNNASVMKDPEQVLHFMDIEELKRREKRVFFPFPPFPIPDAERMKEESGELETQEDNEEEEDEEESALQVKKTAEDLLYSNSSSHGNDNNNNNNNNNNSQISQQLSLTSSGNSSSQSSFPPPSSASLPSAVSSVSDSSSDNKKEKEKDDNPLMILDEKQSSSIQSSSSSSSNKQQKKNGSSSSKKKNKGGKGKSKR